ncbi:MAG: hypothetical protein IK115_02925 [Lachnospiraceae bacterium]|nr:hypothetical protein [Lachnospiraceae bacterium]
MEFIPGQDKANGFSILDPGPRVSDPTETSSFYQDLNLYQLIDKLAAKWGKNVKQYYHYLPETPGAEAYRRAIYGDVKKDDVYQALTKYTAALEDVAVLCSEKEKVHFPMQKVVWQLREIGAYCRATEALEKELEQAELSSEGMLSFLQILKEILDSGGYRQLVERTETLLAQIKELRFIIRYDKDRISVEPGELAGDGAYAEMIKSAGGKEVRHLQNPFLADPSITEIENSCLEILAKKKPELFRALQSTAELNEEYEQPVLKRFSEEVIFYLSFCSLQRELEKKGYPFATPDCSENRRMEAKGLYDVALALSALSTGKEVVPNDLYYEEGECFFVLTGPNQGGKTTFARSLGQLVYFSRMGLDVPAVSANVPFFPDIQTHFSVEESVETGRGKLKEELTRLAPMMEDRKCGSFVVINELFTTAASYDAQIMGRKVLEHFIGLGCMGIYVTHLQELSKGTDGVVSLRAMLNDQRIQTFKIRRGEADDTACAENLVNRYRLTYDQLKERL